ncbi:MAG: hypothetical protein EA362_09445 [Saprospirales bacterium]|nr:MAG: hypothetical protein EA362_09445 [Saprospirales bacterium]
MRTTRRSIFKKSFPLILSELSEALMLLTGVLFLSWESERYLAAIGMIDAALLCCLAYGFALSDSFQRYYARIFASSTQNETSTGILSASVFQFLGVAVLISIVGTVLVWVLSGLYSNELIEICLQSLPFFIPIVLVYYLALPFHAYLVGKGHLQLVGWLACSGVVLNALLIPLFLYYWQLDILPTNAVLLAGLISELVWLVLLFGIIWSKGYFTFSLPSTESVKRLFRVIHRAAFYPGLSIMGFHLGTSLLFVYLSYCCAEHQVAVLTQILAYWSLLIAPVNGMADAANNDFSGIYSRRELTRFSYLRNMYFQVAAGISGLIFTVLMLFNLSFKSPAYDHITLLLIVGLMALLGMLNKLDFVALLARLHNGSFAKIKIIFAFFVIVAVLSTEYFFEFEVVILLTSILLSQILITHWLKNRVQRLWIAS